MNAENNLEPITIDLDKLESTDVLNPNELIFVEQFEFLLGKIREKARSNQFQLMNKSVCRQTGETCGQRKRERNDETRGVPSCFFIDGSRGSGKSTLLRAVRDALVKGKFFRKDETPVYLYPLADVDPTELGKGENFFLYLLGRIYRLLDDKFVERQKDDDETADIRSAMEDLRKMSGGLQVLMDSNAALQKHTNPDLFLEDCVDKCADSMHLRAKLCNLLGKVARIVGKEVFLVTIDDADLNFSKCEDVLEYVRKYMQSPRLIFLFAGDMQLYSHIVRGMHMKNFDGGLLQHDESHKKHRNLMLDRLEDQYLLKLFPVYNRVQTQSLKKILEGKRTLLICHDDKGRRSDTLLWYLREFLSSKINLGVQEKLIDTILQLPARSVFFLLRYLVKNPYDVKDSDSLKYIWAGIQGVFMQALVKNNVDYSQMGGDDIELVQKTIFRYFADAQLWNSDLSLIPMETDAESQQVSVYLSGIVNQTTQSLSAKLRYWCACFPVWQRIHEYYLNTYDSSKTKTLLENALKNGSGRGNNNAWANLACASIAPNMTDLLLYGRGVVCLQNGDRAQDNEKGYDARRGFKSLISELHNVEKEENEEQGKSVMGTLLSLCRLDDSNGSYFHLSIYHLLVNIAQWLDFGTKIQQRIQFLSDKSRDKHLAFRRAVRSRLLGRQFVPHVSRLGNGASSEIKTASLERNELMFDGVSGESIVDEMCTWLVNYAGIEYASAPLDFSRAWSAFVAQCSALTRQYTPEYVENSSCPHAGDIFQKYMLAVEDSFRFLSYQSETKLTDCVASFPFWKSLKCTSPDNQKCIDILNSANIGDHINLKQKKIVEERKNEWEALEAQLPHMSKRKEFLEERLDSVRRFLRNAERERAEKEKELSLHQARYIEISNEAEEAENEFSKLLLAEEELAAVNTSLREVEEQQREAYAKAKQELQRIDNVLAGKSTDFPQFVQLTEDLKRAQRLANQAKMEETRQKHEETVAAIREKIKMYQDEQKKNLPKNVHSKAEKTLDAARLALEITKRKIQEKEQELFSIKRKRIREERRLANMHERNADFRKAVFDVKVGFEQVDTRCKRMEKEVAEWDTEVKAAQLVLEQQMQVVAAAKKAYEDAKKPDKEA